jgi:enoyl-[acyl-carrier-protein] reductase (NADH)
MRRALFADASFILQTKRAFSLAPAGTSVGLTTVALGLVNAHHLLPGGRPPHVKSELRENHQLEDLQGAAVYLASEVSDYMTGHNLVIEGGHTLW